MNVSFGGWHLESSSQKIGNVEQQVVKILDPQGLEAGRHEVTFQDPGIEFLAGLQFGIVNGIPRVTADVAKRVAPLIHDELLRKLVLDEINRSDRVVQIVWGKEA